MIYDTASCKGVAIGAICGGGGDNKNTFDCTCGSSGLACCTYDGNGGGLIITSCKGATFVADYGGGGGNGSTFDCT